MRASVRCATKPLAAPSILGEVLLRAAANRCCVGLSTQKPTERVGVERWVCHLPGKPDRSNLARFGGAFFVAIPASGRRAGAGQIVRALQPSPNRRKPWPAPAAAEPATTSPQFPGQCEIRHCGPIIANPSP